MAEINFNNIYDQMSGTVKNSYDGAAFGKSFADQYDPDKRVANIDEVTGQPTGTFTDSNDLSLTQKDGYTQMVDAYNQEQQSETKNSFLGSLANFGSADASEMMPTNGLQTNSMGGITLNPDGSLNYNNTQPQNLGFRSMVDMANNANNFDSQFVSPNRFNSMGQMGPVKSNMNAPTIDRSNVIGEDIDMQYDNPNYEDIDMGYTNNSFNTQPKQGILQGLQDKIGGLRDFLPFGDKSLSGLAVKGIKSLFEKLGNGADYQQYDPNVDYSKFNPNMEINDFYDPRTKTNRFQRAKPGSFASFRTGADYFKARREKKAVKAAAEAKRQSDLRTVQQRAARGDSYSDIGRDMYTGQGQAFAKQQGTTTGKKGTSTERNYGGRKDGGRIGYNQGGLASMFTRRR